LIVFERSGDFFRLIARARGYGQGREAGTLRKRPKSDRLNALFQLATKLDNKTPKS
jgi:hypothetical protein